MPSKPSVWASVVAVVVGFSVYRYPNLFHSGTLHSTVVDVNLKPIVDVGYTRYQGYVNVTANTTNFLGIRYAAAPIGDLRFAAPQTPSYIPGVQPADKEPETCYQPANMLGTAPTNRFSPIATPEDPTYPHRSIPHWAPLSGSEDCLFLNVFTPGTDLNASLPTVVWIHGGGYIAGGADSYYGPDLINNAHGGVIVVTIQYRLSLFGFLAGKTVKEHGALNAGLLDQELALRWVRDNIYKFGGDPSKVTIWGESAGGGSVMEHVVARGGKTTPPLFSGAIASSPALFSHYNYDDVIPEMIYQEAVTQANCGSANNSLTCLRSTDSHLLRTISSNIVSALFFAKSVFGPVIDAISCIIWTNI